MSENCENARDNKYYGDIQKMRLFDDELLRAVVDGNAEVMELILNILFDREDMKVTGFEDLQEIEDLNGHSVGLDVMAYDDEGNVYDIETHGADMGSLLQRSTYHTSMVDSLLLGPGQDYSDLKPSYVIFFMEEDLFGDGRPIHSFSWYDEDTGKLFGDGHHIFFVNGDNTDVDTRLGKLVHDFKCTSAGDMFYEELAACMRYFKETKEGFGHMSDVCEQIEKRGEKRGEIFGIIKAYRHLHMDDNEIIAVLTETENLSLDKAEEYLHEYYAECRVPT